MSNASDEQKDTRKRKLSTGIIGQDNSPVTAETEKDPSQTLASSFQHFGGIEYRSVLSNSIDQKRVVVEGSYNGDSVIVILDKKPFTDDSLKENLCSGKNKLSCLFQNDIYGSYNCLPVEEFSGEPFKYMVCYPLVDKHKRKEAHEFNLYFLEIKTTIIAPASQKHIEKYTFHPLYLVQETKEIYEQITIPYLERSSFSLNVSSKWGIFKIKTSFVQSYS